MTIQIYWLAQQTLYDILQTLLTLKPSQQPSTSQSRILKDCISYLTAHTDLATKELTSAEQEIAQAWSLLQPLILYLTMGPKSAHVSREPKKDIDELLSWLNQSPSPKLNRDSNGTCILPHWKTIHPLYLHLEVLKCVVNFADTALLLSKQKTHHSNGNFSVDVLGKIKTVAKERAVLIDKGAKEWKKMLERNGVQEVMDACAGGGDVGDVVCDVVGKERMRKYAMEFVESGGECLDGVTKVKV
jgi:hypothetical protein